MAITWNILTGTNNTSGAIARWLNKSSLTAGAGGDADLIVDEAMSWISSRLRHWKMLTAPVSGTMVAGGTGDRIAIPTGMQEPDFFMIAGVVGSTFYQQELRQKLINDVYRSWGYGGTGTRVSQIPMIFSFNQNYLQLDTVPDLAYPYVITYYQNLPALSSTNTTNFLTDDYPRLLRTVTMMIGAEWVKESNQGQYDRTYWAQQAADELMQAQEQSDNARRGAVIDARINVPVTGSFW